MPNYDYDLIVIGSGPAGQRAAIQAAKLDKRVALIERKAVVGGVSVNTGTIPSKTFREAVLDLSGFRERSFYGMSYTVKQNITIEDLLVRTDLVIRHEIDLIRHQLTRNRVELMAATASFQDAHTIKLDYVDARGERLVTTESLSSPPVLRRRWILTSPFDGKRIITSDDILGMDRLPRTLAVSAPASSAGVREHVRRAGCAGHADRPRPRLLPFVDC